MSMPIFVSCRNVNDANALEKANSKKTKLESQGYTLVHTSSSPFSFVLTYKMLNEREVR